MESLSTLVWQQAGLDVDQLLYRWVHVVAGVVWLAMLYGFTLVHQSAMKALDADAQRKVVPEVVARTLFWFQWASLLTWLTGVALLMKLYYSSRSAPLMYAATSEHAGEHMPWSQIGQAFGLLFALFLVYDLLARGAGKLAELSYLAWAVVALGYGSFLDSYLHVSHRAIFIHLGALLGTAMAANVWMTIAPAHRRTAAAVREGRAPDPADIDRAAARSRHNLYMSLPLLFLMVAVHQDRLLGYATWQTPVAAVLLLGLLGGMGIRALGGTIRS